MTRGTAYAGWSLAGAALAILALVIARPAIPVLAQCLVVVIGALVGAPLVRFADWRRRQDLETGERFGNHLLERMRRRRDGSAYRPGGARVDLDPARGSDTEGPGDSRR